MRIFQSLAVLLVTLGFVYLLAKPVPIDPAPWRPTPNTGFTGPFARNGLLARADSIPVPGTGPEDLALGPDGKLYTGLADGRIIRLDPAAGQTDFLADTEGRPLGLRFDRQGQLIVADGVRGLLAVAPNGNVRLLTQSAGGENFGFTDALDIAPDGTIWFSDASRRHGPGSQGMMDFWEARPTGRLLRYDPASGQTRLAIDSLDFANGVAVGPGGAYVLVNETMTGKIHRLRLTGPRAGEHDIFLEGLPGAPDNISYDGRGIFWVALFAPRTTLAERIRGLSPFLRKVAYRIQDLTGSSPVERYGMVIGVDTAGVVRYNLQDPTGRFFATTSALRIGDALFVGSLQRNAVARAALPSPQ